MKSAVTLVEFSFNNTMFKQIDGVPMGSPLSSSLVDIFVGYYEEKLFFQTRKPPTYFKYVDQHLPFSNTMLKQMNSNHT